MNPSPHNDARSDETLIHALNSGDTTAFDALYYRYRDWVARLAMRFTRNEHDALDVLQETFAYFFRKFPGFVLTSKLTTFLYPVVKNLSIAHRRKRQRLETGGRGPDSVVHPQPSQAEQRSELESVLIDLPEGQREILILRFVDDMSLLEISEALGIPEGTVKSRIHNAIAALREDPRVKVHFDR